MKPQERVNAILKSRLEPSARLLLVSIASHMSDGNLQTWISPDTMTEETGLSRSTVMGLLATLTAAGVLTRAEEGHRAKTTRIMWEALAAYQPAATKRGGARVQSDNRTVESDNRTPETDCTNSEQGSEHRTEGSDNRTEASEHRTPNRPIIGPDPIMIRPMIRPVDPGDVSSPSTADLQVATQPEADWDAIEAQIRSHLEARDVVELDLIQPPQPRTPIPPRLALRPATGPAPSILESLAKIREAVEANPAPPPEPPKAAPVQVEEDIGPSPVAGMDLPTLLGSGAATQRLLRGLVAGGVRTAEDLERLTFDDLKFMPQVGQTGANAIREALGRHGAGLALDKGRLILLSRLAAAHPRPYPADVTRADRLALKAGRVRWRELAGADDFRLGDIYKAIEAGRRV